MLIAYLLQSNASFLLLFILPSTILLQILILDALPYFLYVTFFHCHRIALRCITSIFVIFSFFYYECSFIVNPVEEHAFSTDVSFILLRMRDMLRSVSLSTHFSLSNSSFTCLHIFLMSLRKNVFSLPFLGII